jgi:hypothetical protein
MLTKTSHSTFQDATKQHLKEYSKLPHTIKEIKLKINCIPSSKDDRKITSKFSRENKKEESINMRKSMK